MQEPLEVAAAAIDALNRGEWRQVAELVDPEDLERWYSDQVHLPNEPVREITPQQIKRYQPDMPDEVAEYQASRLRKQIEENRFSLHGQFAGVETKAELAQLSPADALSRFLQAQDPEWQFEERLKTIDPRLVPYARQGTPKQRRQPLGLVLEGEEGAHVVYRVLWHVEGEAHPEREMKVATLRRTDAGWRLLLRGELFEHGGSIVVMEAPEGEEGG